jgi:hypothetical protein
MAEAIQCNTSRFFATRKIPSTMIVYRTMKFNLSRFVQSVQPKIPKRNHVLSPQRLIFADTSVRSRPVVPAVPFDASLASPFSHFRFTSLLDLASPEEGLRNPLDLYGEHQHSCLNQPAMNCRIFCRTKSQVNIDVISVRRYPFDTRRRA